MIVPTQVGLIVGGVFSIVAPLCIIGAHPPPS